MNNQKKSVYPQKEKSETVIIPEFYRDLIKDKEKKGLWHFVFKNDENKKPIRTKNGLPYPIEFSWKEMFSTENHPFSETTPIEIEVGSGKGGFLIEYAQKHPEKFILGSEWDYSWATFAQSRIEKAGVLKNTAMLRGDLFYFLRDCVPSNSVDAFHMYFPDPWPKERHHKNRLLRPEFLREVSRVLKFGKRLFYWGTDHKEYNEVALSVFEEFEGCRFLEKNTAKPTEGISTGFERKYLKEGRPIYRSVIEFEKQNF